MVMRTMRNNIGILKWMFVVLLVVFGIGLVLPGTSLGDRDLASAAAVVNGKAVPQRRYSQVLTQRMESARRAAGGELTEAESTQLRKEALQALVDEELAVQHAEDLGQTMSLDEFRDAALNDPSLKNEQGVFDAARYQQLLSMQVQQGLSVADVEAGFQRGMLLSKIRGFFDSQAVLTPAETAAAEAKLNRQVQAQAAVWDLAKVKAGLKIDEEKLRTYYSRNKQRWAKPAEFKLRQILLRTEFGATTVTTKAKADGILSQLKGGASFNTLASKENADDAAKKAAGDLGWLKREDLRHPELQAEVNFIKVGGISNVVQTAEGFHILKLEQKKAGFEPTFENTRGKAEAELRAEEGAREAEKLARQALADVKAGKKLADAAKARNGQVVATGWFDRDNEMALPALGKDASFANQVLTLDLNEAVEGPIITNKAVAIAVLSAERPGKAPTKVDDANARRQVALGQAHAEKSEALYEAWVDSLKKEAKIKDNSGVLASK